MEKIKSFFCKNILLKLSSVALSFALWFVVVTVDDPVDQKRFQNIRVNMVNGELLEDNNQVYEVLDNTDILKTVVFDAPKSVRDVIQAGDIIAEADLANLTVTNTVEIKYSCPKYGAQVQNISGNVEYVKLNIENRDRKWLNIEYKTIGTVAEGFVISKVSLGQNRLEIQGPASAVEQVKKAQVEINVADISDDISTSVSIHLLDRNGNEVERASLVKNLDTVMVEVAVLSKKEVPVVYNVAGTPQEGYRWNGEVQKPIETITLAGPAKTLRKLKQITIGGDVLNVEGASEDVTFEFDIRDLLPNGLSIADPSFDSNVSVVVEIEKLVEKKLYLTQDTVQFVGMPESVSYQWHADEKPYIEIQGLQKDISGITLDNITAKVDIDAYMSKGELKELKPGVYKLPIEVTIDADVDIITQAVLTIQVLEKRDNTDI